MDDAAYIVTMILVFNAAKTKSVIISMFHGYTAQHYVYIQSLLPDLVPILPQVRSYKYLDSIIFNFRIDQDEIIYEL